MSEGNQHSEIEDGGEITNILGRLKRVEAPGNFDLLVKWRITRAASAKTNLPRLRFLPRFAIPAILILLLGVFLFLAGISNFDENSVRVLDESVNLDGGKPDSGETSNNLSLKEFGKSPSNPVRTSQNDIAVPVNRAKQAKVGRKAGGSAKNNGGSSVRAMRANANAIFPLGSDSQTNTKNRGVINARDILAGIGIEAEFIGGWKVKKVTADSPAEFSGVIAGDIIEEIDGRHLDENTTFSGAAAIGAIRLRRGGETINVKLRFQ